MKDVKKRENDNHKQNTSKNIVEKCAAFGFMIGSIVWFLIYFESSDLAFDELIKFMLCGLFIGGLIGEIINDFKKNNK